MLRSCEKHYSKDISSYYIYCENLQDKYDEDYKKLLLQLSNFSNNKLLYIVASPLSFEKWFISENLLGRLRHGNTHIFDF